MHSQLKNIQSNLYHYRFSWSRHKNMGYRP